MKGYDRNQRTGHLLIFTSKKNPRDNFSLFFPVGGLEEFDSLLKINEGFQKCFHALGMEEEYFFNEQSADDINKIAEIVPEIEEKRMVRFDVSQFIDEHSNFIDGFANTILERLASRAEPIFPAIRAGAIATGANFWDREKEFVSMWKKISNGKNLLLRSPRRYGKSSLLKFIQQNPPDDWTICYVDVQGGKSAEDFIELILDGLIRSKECNVCLPQYRLSQELWKLNEAAKIEIKRQERRKIKADWKAYGHALFESMNSNGKKMLLILDEFSYLIEDIIGIDGGETVRGLTAWFYAERQAMKNLLFILSGSEHLPSFLEKYDIDGNIDDLESVPLALFDVPAAKAFIFLLFAKEGISVRLPEITKILALMGEPIPYFLQIFVDLLCTTCRQKGEILSEDIDLIYYQQLLGPDSKRHFESVELQIERYDRYQKRGRLGAEKILNELANKEKVDRQELINVWSEKTGSVDKFDTILNLMKDDFYIFEENGKVSFASRLIKEWWARHGI